MKAVKIAISAWFPGLCWHRLVIRYEQPLEAADAEGPFVVPVHSCAVLYRCSLCQPPHPSVLIRTLSLTTVPSRKLYKGLKTEGNIRRCSLARCKGAAKYNRYEQKLLRVPVTWALESPCSIIIHNAQSYTAM